MSFKKILFSFSFFVIGFFAQATEWIQEKPFNQKVFIENKGQFTSEHNFSNHTILFSGHVGPVPIYFNKNGLTYGFVEHIRESEEELKRKNISIEERERIEHEGKKTYHNIHLNWIGSNPNVEVVGEDAVSFYYTYGNLKDATDKSGFKAKAFKKIIYKNLYPNIDVEYIYPENKEGIKYNIVLHPGANPSLIKIEYEGIENISLNSIGNLLFEKGKVNFIDHSPISFYKNDNSKIKTSYKLTGNIISFEIENYDKTKEVIIDPWVTVPNFTNYDAGYDIAYDLQGNVYAYGGHGQWSTSPYEVIKFDNVGTILWVFVASFPLTGSTNYGGFTVDKNTGSVYICEPYRQGLGARVIKLNNAGTQIGISTGVANFEEMWRIEYDYFTQKLIIGGGNVTVNMLDQAAYMDTALTTLSTFNPFNATTRLHDITLLTVDNCGNYFMATPRSFQYPAVLSNILVKGPTSTIVPRAYAIPNGHVFRETACIPYVNNNQGPWGPVGSNTNSFNGIAVNSTNVFTYDGGLIKRWNKNTGAIVTQSNFAPTDTFQTGGITADDCGNIFIGHLNTIKRLDNTLALQATINAPNSVYDVVLAPGNIVYACGRSFVASFNSNVTCTNPPSPININITLGGPCNAPNATASASGGTPTYNYSWSGGGGNSATTGALTPGTYTVTVTDAACNSKTQTVTVSSSSINTPTSSTPALCTASNGSATVTPSGGTPGYSYLWSNGDTTATTTSGLAPGTYTVTVTDNGGCSQTATVTVASNNGGLTASATSTPALCTASNGTATATPASGTPNYSYVWAPLGGNAATANGLSPATYTVTVTDGNGCTATATVTVGQTNGSLTATVATTPALCTATNGTATATPASGTPNYSYVWTPSGGGAATANNLAPGTYTVTVTDGNGCTTTASATVGQSSGSLTTSATATPSLCLANDGTATATPSGGTAGYNYAWAPSGGNAATATNLAPGTYTVIVTDVNGCTATTTATVAQSSGTLTVGATSTPSLCVSNNGTATATPSGGTAGYNYVWAPSGGSAATANNLAPGTYTVTVTDASGCTNTALTTVAQSSGTLAATVSSTPNLCGANNGTATAVATGGTPNYTYSWAPSGGSGATASGLTGGTYTVTITDVSGCTQVQTVVVPSIPGPTATVSANVTINIKDSTNLSATGGGTYSWTPTTGLSCTNCANPIAKPFQTTTYCVTVKDNNNCTSSACVTVTVEIPCPTNENLMVPNAFSPNKDGINDEFCLLGWETCLEDFKVLIFDRWGEKVFESIDPNFCWDGTYLNNPMDAQVFVYHIKARFINLDKPVVKKGNISLIK